MSAIRPEVLTWARETAGLSLEDAAHANRLNLVVEQGYANDLTDDQLEEIGRDPFLVAYAMSGAGRCVVTREVSRPSKKRQNRRLPDVCVTFGVPWCDPFQANRNLGFKTGWKGSR